MSSKSGGNGNKKRGTMGNSGIVTAAQTTKASTGSVLTDDEPCSSSQERCDNGFIPLESRLMEIKDANGSIIEVPALDKRWAPLPNFGEFYIPSCQTLLEDQTSIISWLDYMEMYCNYVKWLLSVPHHQFWSVMVYTPEVSQVVLNSFLERAPQWHDKDFPVYVEHEVIGPKYQEVYILMFRVFIRLCTYKESKKDFISPVTWASLLVDREIIDIQKLQNLCNLYDTENNQLLPKMLENVMKSSPKLQSAFRNSIPVVLTKSAEMTEELRHRIRESSATNVWNQDIYEEILSYFLSSTCGLYKFCKLYSPASEAVMKFPNALMKLAYTYEPQCCTLWSQVIANIPIIEERVKVLRVSIIRLFRVALANSTINLVSSSNDQRIDEYFEVLTNCLDEKMFIRDYEKVYPFRQDINAMLSKGIFIDETRIDYIANAISSCFNACGEDYAVEKIVVDPLYDPNFDRQLLGACSLEVTGVELQSLVTQVKDILSELPDSYVEAVLKHYGYKAEVSINALLEGSVPLRLEKYKNENYVKPLKNPPSSTPEDTELEKLASKLVIQDSGFEAEKFYSGKRSHGFGDDVLTHRNSRLSALTTKDESEWLQPKTKELVARMQEEASEERPTIIRKPGRGRSQTNEPEVIKERYIDESLLPSYRSAFDYEDEYDDTYDEHGVGMVEPDNNEYKPLNQKKQITVDEDDEDEDDDEDPNKKRLDFCEDPAIVRARFERRREEKSQQHHRRGGGGGQSADVVGRAKGHGQEKDVLYARRQKNVNKDRGGYKKKRADFKRREF